MLAAGAAIFVFISCQKSVDDFYNNGAPASARTVENISGVYSLKALTWSYLSTTVSIYDSLDTCEKDDLYKFNADMTMNLIDAGSPCSPPGDETQPWILRNDSIFLGSSANGAKIKSFDGTTLVLTGTPGSDPNVSAVTTFVKK